MPSVFDSNTIPTDNRILRVNIYRSPIPLFAPILINIDRGSISPGYFHKIANAWLSKISKIGYRYEILNEGFFPLLFPFSKFKILLVVNQVQD